MKCMLSLLLVFATCPFVYAQTAYIDKVQFFNDSSLIKATILTNTNKLFGKSKKGYILPGHFIASFSNGTVAESQVMLETRGHFRHDYCYFPPLKLIFKEDKSSVLYSLKSLKLVSQCKEFGDFDQYLLREYIAYKIFNMFTDMSFRVRLLDLNLQDSVKKKRVTNEHAFLIEDIKDLAKRNECNEWDKQKNLNTESTNRRQMTIVSLFEYMIGNSDFSVSAKHNMKLIVAKVDSLTKPFVVPYDFDYSGFVNTDYAIPDEKLNIETVRERIYRGYPRTMEELDEALSIFKLQKENIYTLIKHFNLLSNESKRDMLAYLDSFYSTINNPAEVKSTFIDGARKK